MTKYWNSYTECMDRDELQIIQFGRLKGMLNHVYDNVPIYRNMFASLKTFPQEITDFNSLAKLNLITRKDLEKTPFNQLQSFPQSEILRILSINNSSKNSPLIGYTKKDLETMNEAIGRSITAIGICDTDMVHIALEYGMSGSGSCVQNAIEKIGSSIIPAGSLSVSAHISLLENFHSNVIFASLHTICEIAEKILSKGSCPNINLNKIVVVGEPISREKRVFIESVFHAPVFQLLSVKEIISVGVGCECEKHNGIHLHEDLFYPEVINPVSLETLNIGALGELVLTTLTKQATPLLRFRTGLIGNISHEKCFCGRTSVRFFLKD